MAQFYFYLKTKRIIQKYLAICYLATCKIQFEFAFDLFPNLAILSPDLDLYIFSPLHTVTKYHCNIYIFTLMKFTGQLKITFFLVFLKNILQITNHSLKAFWVSPDLSNMVLKSQDDERKIKVYYFATFFENHNKIKFQQLERKLYKK